VKKEMNWDELEEHERLARERAAREKEDSSFSSSEEECDFEASRSFLEVAACDEVPIVSGWESAYDCRISVPKMWSRKRRRSTLKVRIGGGTWGWS
jgi:hypothetical protein